jgi:hypothetical protein
MSSEYGGMAGRAFRALLLAAGVAAMAAPALAQDSPGGPIDPQRLALAREYMRESHIDAAMRGVLANMARSMPQLSADGATDVKGRQLANSFSVGMDAALPQLMDTTAQATARVFTTQELKDLVTFYGSPSGRSMVAKMPELMQQVGPMAMQIMQTVYTTAEADYCRHETCTEADHARFQRLQSALRAAPRPPPGAE